MTAYDEIEIASIGDKKTAVFVVVSDTDRSMDPFVNTFFTQALNVLCEHADNDCDDNRLPIDVRFILDDFATNCIIEEFPRMISSIRSRGISTMLMIQAESQLSASYGNDGRTIVSNCDTYVYLGGNDYETADLVAQRLNVPVGDILYMGIGECVVFRRGSKPYRGNIFNLDKLVIRQQCQIKGGLEENERAV
jgi:type IV secretion system protein VirD4